MNEDKSVCQPISSAEEKLAKPLETLMKVCAMVRVCMCNQSNAETISAATNESSITHCPPLSGT